VLYLFIPDSFASPFPSLMPHLPHDLKTTKTMVYFCSHYIIIVYLTWAAFGSRPFSCWGAWWHRVEFPSVVHILTHIYRLQQVLPSIGR
jgi:hypothetical protein